MLIGSYRGYMCRNITTLRGLEPPATDDEVHAAALQYVRKVTGVTTAGMARPEFQAAVLAVATASRDVLAALPPRRNPPPTEPPLRRRAAAQG